MKDALFVIWSWEHHSWWAPNRQGYAEHLEQAGRYSFQEAADIVVGYIPAGEEVAVLEAEAIHRGQPKRFL